MAQLALKNQLISISQIKKRIFAFERGNEALEHFLQANKSKSEDNIHLIITDNQMPGMNGAELTQKVIILY